MEKKTTEGKYDVVIIGAGIAGLVCGATLAQAGKRVKLIEQHSLAGGYCTSFKRKGFTFNAAAVRINGAGRGEVLYNVLERLGLEKRLSFHRIEPLFKIISPEGSFYITKDFEQYKQLLYDNFPKQESKISDLFSTLQTIHQTSTTSPDLLKYRDMSFKQLVESYVKDSRVLFYLTAIADSALPPSRTSAIFFAKTLLEHFAQGTYIVEGGSQNLSNALADSFQEHGGELELGTMVEKIIVQDGKATGIRTTQGEQIDADVVVSNGAAISTFFNLVGKEHLSQDFISDIQRKEVGLPSFFVYLGIDMDPRAVGFDAVDTFLWESFDTDMGLSIPLKGQFPLPYCEIIAPTLIDKTQAPEGCHTLGIISYAPYDIKGKDWREEKDHFTEAIIKMVEQVIPGLSDHIVVKDAATPLTMERYTLNTQGAVMGWALSPEMYFAKPERKTPIDNLYLAGHWTTPATGIIGVTVSGLRVARTIIGETE
ncbi:MAG: NAD(P)/FAD-dependent oxidoreductase [Desulfatiglans sp.]|jgi:prolycopene isomerase|nr:NAD(P)/FAD-dependent oxidoreductase [Desulfatiglans sp.]